MERPIRVRVWGVTALLSTALALAGAGLLTAQTPNADAAPLITLNRADGSATDVRAAARSKLLQGRAYLGQGHFHLAESAAAEVAALNLSYAASEDSPARLLDDVKKAKNDPKALLHAARAALERKDYDRADAYARSAEQKAGTFTFPVWSDSPARVLEEVKAARKTAPVAKEKAKPAPKSEIVQAGHVEEAPKAAAKQPATPAGSVMHAEAKMRLSQGRAMLGQGDFDGAERLAQEAGALGVTYSASEDTPAKLQQDVQKGRGDPKLLLLAAKAALNRKDYDQAEGYARLAEKNAGSFSFPVWSDSPAGVIKQVEAARKSAAPKETQAKAPAAAPKQPEKAVAKKDAPKPAVVQASHAEQAPQPKMQPSPADAAARARAKGRLAEGRASLGMGDFDGAESVALEIAALGLTFATGEDSPAKLLDDVQKGHNDPKLLMLAARSAFGRKDYDTAERYARLAEKNAGSFSFPIWSDSPSGLLKQIEAVRNPAPKREVVKAPPPVPTKQPEKAVVKQEVPATLTKQPEGVVEKKETLAPAAKQPEKAVMKKDESPKPADAAARGRAKARLVEGRTMLALGDLDGADRAAQDVASLGLTYSAADDTPAKLQQDVRKGRSDPKLLMTAARLCLTRKGYDDAEKYAKLAKKNAGTFTFPVWAESPDELLGKIEAARKPAMKKDALVKAPAPTKQPEKAVEKTENKAVVKTEAKSPSDEKARGLIKQGRAAVQQGKLDEAKNFAMQARELKPNLSWWDDNPDRLLDDVQRLENSRPKPASVKDSKPAGPDDTPRTKAEARTMLAKGRELLVAGKLDDAFETAQNAKAAKGTEWGLFEDSPDRLVLDVQKARGKRDREEADRLLAEGRKLLEKGDHEGAAKLAYRAQKLNGTYTIWDLGDRPSKLLADCQAAQARAHKTELPPATGTRKDERPTVQVKATPPQAKAPEPKAPEPKRTEVASNDPPPAPKRTEVASNDPPPAPKPVETPKLDAPPAPPKSEISLVSAPPAPLVPPPPPTALPVSDVPPPSPERENPNKLRAQQLVAEAQRLLREGKLPEARQKAVEAQSLKVTFTIDETSPDLIYQQVATEARSRIDALVRQANDEAQYGQGDGAARHQTAERWLGEAKQLAVSFGQDVRPIDDKLAEVRRRRDAVNNAQVNNQTPAAPPAQQPPVEQDLLAKARLELHRGETKMARTMCEEVLRTKNGLHDEAVALLRTIDAEEFNQQTLAVNRTFDAANWAYRQGDKTRAAGMISALDTRLLSADRQERLREMALTPEMYGQPQTTGMARATDRAGEKKQPLPVPPGGLTRTGSDGMPGEAPGGVRQTAGEGRATATDRSGDDVLAAQKQRMSVLGQQLRRDGIDAMNRAADRLRAGDHEGAIEILSAYMRMLEEKQDLDPGQLTLLRKPIDARISQYNLLRQQRDLVRGRAAPRENGMAEVKSRMDAEELKKKNVEKLMREFNALYREGKYDDAAALAMRAHELDPDNPTVTGAITLAQRHKALDDSKAIRKSRNDWFDDALDQVERYPGSRAAREDIDLPEKAARRNRERAKDGKGQLLPGKKSERDKDIERKLLTPVRMNFENAPLKQVLNDLRDANSINIVPDYPAFQEAGISLDSPVTIQLDQVSLKSALNHILHQVKLTYIIKDEVLNVTTEEHARGKLVAATYPVGDLVIPVENFGDLQTGPSPPNSTTNVGGSGPYGPNPITGRLGLQNGQPVGQPNYPSGSAPVGSGAGNGTPGVSKSRPTNTMQTELINLITKSISPTSWSDNGGPGTVEFYPLTLALVINQTPDIQEQIQDLLAALRRLQDQEVSIEVRFVTVSEDFFERIGVNFNVNILTDGLTRKFEPALVNNAFVQDPNNFINNLNFGRFLSGAGPGGTLTPTLDIPLTNNSFFSTFPAYGGYVPGTGLTLGLAFLSDIQVFLFLEAVQGDVRSNLMQAPKLTLFNGQTASITATDTTSLLTNVQIQPTGDGNFFFQPVVQQVQSGGMQMTLNAAISADRRFVRISLTHSFQSLRRSLTTQQPFSVPVFLNAANQGGFANGVQPILITNFLTLPVFSSLTVQTTVVVPDGGTVVMGGLKQLSEERTEYGPPILSKIPYVNRLFKNVGYGRSSDSLLIMVTPRIIIQEEEEERATGFQRSAAIAQ